MDTNTQAAQDIQAVLQKYGKKFEVVHSVVINDVTPSQPQAINEPAEEAPAPTEPTPEAPVEAQEPQPEVTQ